MTPREVELRVPLRSYRSPPDVATGVSVSLSRGVHALRVISARFTESAPREEWRTHVSIPLGDYEAEVTVEMGARVVRAVSPVHVVPGELLRLRAP